MIVREGVKPILHTPANGPWSVLSRIFEPKQRELVREYVQVEVGHAVCTRVEISAVRIAQSKDLHNLKESSESRAANDMLDAVLPPLLMLGSALVL
jgi:hypothetical protein